MRLWTPDTDPGDNPTEFAKERLADALERVEIWGRREEYARQNRQLWEQRVRGYKNRLGIKVEEPVSG